MLRDHTAGTLSVADDGATVVLAGWVARRRDHGGVIFIDLRDASGVVQVVFREGDMAAAAHRLRNEFCVQGDRHRRRPAGRQREPRPADRRHRDHRRPHSRCCSESAPLPFQIDDDTEIGEETRLKYRYLDLRRSGPAAALRLRSAVNRAARNVLDAHDFVEIETPTLTRSTPEGARDFLVPARLRPG